MQGCDNKQRIIEHYDFASPYYRELWGEHLHHGYWVNGSESKEEAQAALIDHLAQAAQIPEGATILDVGCGFGGSSIYLAGRYRSAQTGITISRIQAEMARQAAREAGVPVRFLVMDADHITLKAKFDVVWSIEAISHFTNKAGFFRQSSALLNNGGTLALVDWFAQEHLSTADRRAYIEPIERGMLVALNTMPDYAEMIRAAGLRIVRLSDLSVRCARTWEISAKLIKNRSLWRIARKRGDEFIRFLRSFHAMRKGFASGNFVYGMIIARKG